MRTKYLAKHTYSAIGLLSLVLRIALPIASISAAFGIPIQNEYWFAPRADGQSGIGTLDDPYNGNPSFFDSLINGTSANSTIHLLAGTYQTLGIQMKAGQRILGSGVDVTTLRNISTGAESIAIFYNDGLGGSVEIADLTVDCNTPQPQTGHGIVLLGTKCSVRRVKVINAAGVTTTSFPIKIYSPTNANSDGNIIEDCEVSGLQGWGSANAAGITLQGWGSYNITGIIRHNRVKLGFNSGCTAYLVGNSQSCLVEGNFANVCGYGFASGGNNGDQLLLSHNTFRNCQSGGIMISANVTGQNQSSGSIIFNQVEVTNSVSCVNLTASSGGTVKNFVVLGNKMRYVNGMIGSGGYGININGVQGFTALNNSIDSTMANTFGASTTLNVYNNFDFSGAILTGLNQIAPVAGLTRKKISQDYTILYTDKYIGVGTVPRALTLPSAVGHEGKDFIIVDESGSASGSNLITIQTVLNQQINGGSVATITVPYGSKRLVSDGANWFLY